MKKILTSHFFLILILRSTAQFGEPVIVGNNFSSWVGAYANFIGSDTLEAMTYSGIYTINPNEIAEPIPHPQCYFHFFDDQIGYHINTDTWNDDYCVNESFILHFSDPDSLMMNITSYFGCESVDCFNDSSLFQSVFLSNNIPPNNSVVEETFYDIDEDGDSDCFAVIAEFFGSDYFTLVILENLNSNFQKISELPICGECGPYLPIFFEDLNDDGLVDITTVGEDYRLGYIQQTSPMTFGFADPEFLSEPAYNELFGTSFMTLPFIDDTNADGLPEIIYYYSGGGNSIWQAAVFNNLGDFIFELSYEWLDPPFETPFASDFDQDGDLDYFQTPTIEGQTMLYYYRNEGNNQWTSFFLDEGMSSGGEVDYDLDGDMDFIYGSGSSLKLLENTGVTMIPDAGFVALKSFLDINSNSTYDLGETIIQSSVSINDFFAFSTSSETTYLGLQPSVYTMVAIPSSDNWSGISVTIDLDSYDSIIVYLPVILVDSSSSISSNLYILANFCNAQTDAYIQVTNNGGTIIDEISIALQLDSLFQYVSSVYPLDSISENNLFWTIADISPFQTVNILFNVVRPSSTEIGETTNHVLEILIAEENISISQSFSEVVECSYDPNDITEHNGHTDAGYILTGDELEYTIRFQNTGNAPAQDVRIENQLSEKLDWSTMQPIAWSHDFQLMIDETGRAIFTFDEINLPDSVNNEAESHGFVRYRILSDEDLSAEEIIENTAEIFFDFNPAVVTNTEMNTIYDCTDLEQINATTTEVCTGESIDLGNNATWIEALTWTFEGVEVGSGDYTHVVNESGTMVMHASNALCSYDQSIEITVLVATASFTQNGNTLSASNAATYQWYLNGNAIANATAQTFEITQTGNYSVMITDENGCSAMSDAMIVTYTGIDELNSNTISIYPNPASEFFTLSISNDLIGNEIVITDMLGKVVMYCGEANNHSTRIETSALAHGVYEVHIGKVDTVLLRK